MMEREKIYYAAVIFISTVSILLSPFFYIRRTHRPENGRSAKRRRWCAVAAGNILMASALLAVWWFWLRRQS